jgi:hypothetical protein
MAIINLADNKKIRTRAEELVYPVYQWVRNNRTTLESRWEQFWNCWKVYVDTRYYYGQSNIYLPIIRKNTEEGIQNITTKLFPTDDFLGVLPMPGTPNNYALAVKDMLIFQMLEDMRLPLEIKSCLRDMLVCGTSVGKLYFDPFLRCPKLNALSIMEDFYLYPTTVADIDEAMITFERMIVDRFELERMAEIGKYINIDELSETGSTEANANKERTEKSINQPLERHAKLATYDLVEAWTEMELNDSKREPVTITFDPTKKVILQITPSPLKYKTPSGDMMAFKPYVGMPLIKNPKSFYGHSIYEVSQRLQYALNDCANLVLDNGILIQNPIVKMDTARVNNPASCVFKPRAKWECEPDAVVFDRPPDVLQSGLMLLQQLKFWTEENSNIGGMTPMTTKRTTATEISTFNQLLGTFIASTIVDIEYGFTLPLAKKVFWLDQIYLNSKDIRRILGAKGDYIQLGKGKEGTIVKKDYMFRWLGSTQSMNIHIKGQQTINFIGVAASIPPQLMGGKRVAFDKLLEDGWAALGNTNAEQIIIDDTNTPEREPQEENEILADGKEVNVNVKDNDIHHIMTHNAKAEGITDEAILKMFVVHIQKHIQQAQMKFQISQMPPQMMGGGAGMTPPPSGGATPPGNLPLPPTTVQAPDMGAVASTTFNAQPPKKANRALA